MSLVWAALIVAAVAAPAVAAMLLVRRSAPEGSRFSDGDRASGVFGVLRTFDQALLAVGAEADPPCNEKGQRTS